MRRSRPSHLLPLLALLLLSCSDVSSPGATVLAAVASARAGDLDGFAARFTPESAPLLSVFWSVSTRYGYLDDDSLRYLADAEVVAEEIHGERARVDIRTAGRNGFLCLAESADGWRIDLLASEDCSGPIPTDEEVPR